MTTKTKPVAPENDSPALWACKYIIAFTEGRLADAREFQERLKDCGFTIRPNRKGATS